MSTRPLLVPHLREEEHEPLAPRLFPKVSMFREAIGGFEPVSARRNV